jgi:hypothetical protein
MVSLAVLKLYWLFGSPLYDACKVTWPAFVAVIVTEHAPCESVHAFELKETVPVPLWDQLTSPVGE